MTNATSKTVSVRNLTVVAVMSAVATILMFIQFGLPIMPSFIQLDFSELPALITAFALGPISGAAVCLVKNLIHLFMTTTGGVGELCNFLIGAAFVVPAGLIYRHMRKRSGALVGALVGAFTMAIVSIPLNYFVTYPMYSLFMPMEAILGMYQAINPRIETLIQALVVFNAPFTFFKGMASVAISFLIYKRISVLIKGK